MKGKVGWVGEDWVTVRKEGGMVTPREGGRGR